MCHNNETFTVEFYFVCYSIHNFLSCPYSKIRFKITCSYFIIIAYIVGYEFNTMSLLMTVTTTTVNTSSEFIAHYVRYNEIALRNMKFHFEVSWKKAIKFPMLKGFMTMN